MNSDEQGGNSAGVSRLGVEMAVVVLLFAFGATVMVDSFRLGASWSSDGPGAGYFPFYVGLLICASAVVILVQVLIAERKARDSGLAGAITRRWGQFVSRPAFRQVLSVFIPAIVYVFVVQLIGIYVASAVYIAVFMAWLGRYSILKGALAGFGVTACVFLLFEVWFKVPLYKGIVDPLAWLGY